MSGDGLRLAVLDAFRETLQDTSLEAGDDFFEAGGQSLLAVELAEAIATRLGVAVSPMAVFDHPTAAELAGAIEVDAG